jgi:hypothetical protein
MAFSATHVFTERGPGRAILTVQANGGSVEVQVEHTAGVWITADTISADYAGEIIFGQASVRIVPMGGATYMVR